MIWFGSVWGWGIVAGVILLAVAWLFSKIHDNEGAIVFGSLGCFVVAISVFINTPQEEAQEVQAHIRQFQQAMADCEWEVLAPWDETQDSTDPTHNSWLVEKSNPSGTLRGKLTWNNGKPEVSEVSLIPESVLRAEEESHVIVRIVKENTLP